MKNYNITIICEECGKIFERNKRTAKISFDKFKKYICFYCARKGERNPFYNKKFSEEQIKKLSKIRKDYYNDPDLGDIRRKKQSERW